jgi:hypothetical protein
VAINATTNDVFGTQRAESGNSDFRAGQMAGDAATAGAGAYETLQNAAGSIAFDIGTGGAGALTISAQVALVAVPAVVTTRATTNLVTDVKRRTRAVTTTTTRRGGTTRESILWSGQFHFLISPECDISYLQGRMGGYVSAIAVASSESDFIVKAKAALRERMLIPDDEYDDIEDISARYQKRNLSDEWIQLCREALETGGVVFTTFDLYNSV